MAALSIEGVPASCSHAEMHALVTQFASVDRIITISSGGALEGGALVLLPPAAGAELAATTAEVLDLYPLDGGLLDVRICENPREWLLEKAGLQLAPPLPQLAPPLPAVLQSADNGSGGEARAELEYNFPAPDEVDEGDDAAWQQVNNNHRSSSRGGGGGESRGRPSSSSSSGSSSGGGGGGGRDDSGDPPTANPSIVLKNVCADYSAQQLGDFLCRFGPLEECSRPVGTRFLLVRFATLEAAAAAKAALDNQLVEELNPEGPVTVQYRLQYQSAGQRAPYSWREQLSAGQLPQAPQGASATCLVVHNVLPAVGWWEIAEVFRRFGALASCSKRPEARFAFVEFAKPEAAAAAVAALHGQQVPQLNRKGVVALEFRRLTNSSSSSDGTDGGGEGSRGKRFGGSGGGGRDVRGSGRTTPDAVPTWRR